jgi:hypothetical protein
MTSDLVKSFVGRIVSCGRMNRHDGNDILQAYLAYARPPCFGRSRVRFGETDGVSYTQICVDRIFEHYLPHFPLARKPSRRSLRGHETRSLIDIEVVRGKGGRVDDAYRGADRNVRAGKRKEVVWW